jgi:putative phosphoribosyl transferase
MRATAVAADLSYPIVEIPSGDVTLEAELHVPPQSRGLIVLVNGSAYSRHDPRHVCLVSQLEQRRFATLVPDLLTSDEEAFDQPLLVERLLAVREWAQRHWSTHLLPIGYFASSTGAAAAVAAAAQQPREVFAIVSAGGRPDLAWDLLPNVTAATLLIVGSCDPVVEELNRQALQRLTCPAAQFRIVQGAGRWFEAPGALDEMATMATDWFGRHWPRTSAR